MVAPRFKASFLCPKYWGIWVGFFLLKLLSLLPYRFKFSVGKAIGEIFYLLAKSRRELARKNIQQCFPEKSPQACEEILKQHFASLGINLMETTINIWGKHHKNAKKNESQHFTFKGLEHLKANENHGILLVVPHFTTIEITGLMISFITEYRPIYRPHDNPLMEYLITQSRTVSEHDDPLGRSVKPVSNKNTRELITQLRDHKNLMILPDQKYTNQGHILVPFFGFMAPSNPGINKLAKLGKAKVIPIFTRRKGHEYELEFLPPLENFPTGDDYQDILTMHKLYETEIKQNPAQYLWVHNRWNNKNQQAIPSD